MTLLHSSRVFLLAGLIAILVQSAFAHTYLSSVVVNSEALIEGDCVRPHPLNTGYDAPISLVSSINMTCGFLPEAANPSNRKCPIAAGSTIGLQWHHENDQVGDNIIDPSHVGPIIVYLAKSDSGAGNVWFKIYEDGYNAADGLWAVNRLINNNGLVTIPIPSDIAPGNYLLRGEVIALHGANALNGVQPYVGCVELTISGSGSATPTGVAFPGYYQNTDPGMFFDIYQPFSSYPIPGPALYTSSSSSPVTPTSAPAAPTSAPPTSAPTTAPSAPSTGNLMVQLNGGSSVWWLGVIVSGGGQTTVKVELMDSGAVSSWTSLVVMPYAYVYDLSIQLTLPISIRVTSSSGSQVVLTNVFTSFTSVLIDSGKTFSGATAPTSAPVAPTHAPTSAPAPTYAPVTPTSAPTTAPTSGAAHVTVYPSASAWWFAVTVSGNSAAVATVEIKDSGSVSTWTTMTYNPWGYAYATQGTALVAPLTVRVTSVAGKSVTATIPSITPNAVAAASGSL